MIDACLNGSEDATKIHQPPQLTRVGCGLISQVIPLRNSRRPNAQSIEEFRQFDARLTDATVCLPAMVIPAIITDQFDHRVQMQRSDLRQVAESRS